MDWLSEIVSIVTAMLLFYMQRQQKKRDTLHDEREHSKHEQINIMLEVQAATAKMGYANAKAIQRGKPNGEVEEGIKAYETAIEKYDRFMRSLASDNL